jgi:hypothetical protein
MWENIYVHRHFWTYFLAFGSQVISWSATHITPSKSACVFIWKFEKVCGPKLCARSCANWFCGLRCSKILFQIIESSEGTLPYFWRLCEFWGAVWLKGTFLVMVLNISITSPLPYVYSPYWAQHGSTLYVLYLKTRSRALHTKIFRWWWLWFIDKVCSEELYLQLTVWGRTFYLTRVQACAKQSPAIVL